MHTAYPTASACTHAIDQEEAQARRGIPFLDVTRRAPTDLSVMDRKAEWVRVWQCLPASLDPRGPKGK
jgi:hypothetical protein